jgi:hypothetical protein
MFEPGTLVKNADPKLEPLDKFTFIVVGVDNMGIAKLEVIGHDALGFIYLWAKDLKRAEPEVQEVS